MYRDYTDYARGALGAKVGGTRVLQAKAQGRPYLVLVLGCIYRLLADVRWTSNGASNSMVHLYSRAVLVVHRSLILFSTGTHSRVRESAKVCGHTCLYKVSIHKIGTVKNRGEWVMSHECEKRAIFYGSMEYLVVLYIVLYSIPLY
jgi:hypothetical protein